MSNCHDDFLKFNNRISLTSFEKGKLQSSGNAIKRRIESYLKAKGYPHPKFKIQGSFAMGTNIRPQEGFYDLDLGVYISDLKGDDDSWPRTESIHNLILRAVDGHTTIKPISKKSCVRVMYKSPYIDNSDISYHIDLPIYAWKSSFWSDELRTVIGFKGDKQWSEYSDPQQFVNWFDARCSINNRDPLQLRRLVKYLKAWKDKLPLSPKLPSGMVLTVLAAKNYVPHERDDLSFLKTVTAYYDLLWWSFSIKKPVEPFNDLADGFTDTEEENFMTRTKALLSNSNEAILAKGYKSALYSWSKVFGGRFNSI